MQDRCFHALFWECLQNINHNRMENIKKVLCCQDERLFPDPYNFSFGSNDELNDNRLAFEGNFVRTSKYRWYTFLPKSLLLQFQRLANIYFLIIAILQSISVISPLGPLTAWAPLIVVLGISMMREGYEDYQRYKSDQNLNHQQKTCVLRPSGWEQIEWSQVVVGDICKVLEDQRFPADLILLYSAFSDGHAFIETASLDGEKNLKPRCAFPETQNLINQQKDKLKEAKLPESKQQEAKQQEAKYKKEFLLRGEFKGKVPDKELHEFSSEMEVAGRTTVKLHIQRDKQLLYREARLKNTQQIIGLVIYTGRNTKIMMNSQGESNKMSQIEYKVNYILGFILLFQLILCIILGFLDGAFLSANSNSDTYILWGGNSPVGDGFLIFCSYLVLLNTMIPISLIVSIEIVKMSQSYFIDNDKFMYSHFREKGPSVRSASLNEELGQIEYVFTDKTGTLTTNRMEFKIALIGRRLYGDIGLIASQVPQQKGVGFEDRNLQELLLRGVGNEIIPTVVIANRQGNDRAEIKSLKELAQEYFTALSVAHEVVVATDAHGVVRYQGPSPDEITLVQAAKVMGYQFLSSSQAASTISINKTKKEFRLLESFTFSSDRKRMSVVVREIKDGKETGRIKMYTKGADNIIKSRLAQKQAFELDHQLEKFSRVGLRTLLIAMRYISQDQYMKFKSDCNSLPLENKEKAMEPLVNELETDLYLIGATAVLDRLQDQVPETIRDLIRANIKVWMLTGDKMETAENIAKSCKLIQPGFTVLRHECKDKNKEVLHTKLQQLIQNAKKQSEGQQRKVSLLIQGPDLTPIMGVAQLEKDLAELSLYCESVVCCRLLPSQKADVVRVVREQLGRITLAIGDGANDVPMIKEAHIGVGLFGEEGMGSVLASDYALPEFRMLWRLLLVHGRWNYMRIAEMILYFFYKNMLFTFPQFIYAFYCAYSGQTIFDDIYISLYNLIFTSFPLIVRAIFQQDVNYIRPVKEVEHDNNDGSANAVQPQQHVLDTLYSQYLPPKYQINKYLYRIFPKMYFVGQQNCIFNFKNFGFWVLQGIVEAIIVSMFSIYILSSESFSNSGYTTDMWLVSVTIFTCVMMLVTFKLATHTKFWSLISFVSVLVLSLGLYFSYMWISNYYFSYVVNDVEIFFSEANTYFIVIFCVCAVLFIDGIVLTMDSKYSGVINKMRILIDEQKEDRYTNYENESVTITVKTVAPQ